MFTPLLIALFLMFQPVQADSVITISGSVMDLESQTVISGASITFMESDSVVTSNEEGYFTFDVLSTGTYTVLVEAEGYKSQEMTIEVTESRVLKIELEKSPVEKFENEDMN